MIGAACERAFDHAQDEAELAMVDPDQDQAPGVVLAGRRPLANDAREVPDVERDHDSLLVGGELEQCVVLPTIELALLVRRANVVAALAKCSGDYTPRDVGVEKEPHGGLLEHDRVDGGKLALELRQRRLALANRVVDFFSKLFVVRQGETDLSL